MEETLENPGSNEEPEWYFEHVTCCACGMYFAVPRKFRNHLLTEGGALYCPQGHAQIFQRTRQLYEKRLAIKDRHIEHLEEKVKWLEEKLAQR